MIQLPIKRIQIQQAQFLHPLSLQYNDHKSFSSSKKLTADRSSIPIHSQIHQITAQTKWSQNSFLYINNQAQKYSLRPKIWKKKKENLYTCKNISSSQVTTTIRNLKKKKKSTNNPLLTELNPSYRLIKRGPFVLGKSGWEKECERKEWEKKTKKKVSFSVNFIVGRDYCWEEKNGIGSFCSRQRNLNLLTICTAKEPREVASKGIFRIWV